MDGILLINKPIGWTSRDVVNKLTRKFNTKKIGHTGTLDPFASGLLIVTVGKATKISSYLEGLDKEYIAELTLGKNTTTLDLDGEVIEEFKVNLPLDRTKIDEVINKYIGEIYQTPPMYSALKVDGEALYKKARRGEIVERKKRKVCIHSIDVLSIENEKIMMNVKCSKGTYIRTLGNDIGNDLQLGGYLSLLTRIKVGKYELKDAKNIEEISENDLISIEEALSYLPKLIVDGALEKMVSNGVSLFLKAPDFVYIESKSGEAIALYKKEEDGKHHCLRGLK